jgi:hypothetical protein
MKRYILLFNIILFNSKYLNLANDISDKFKEDSIIISQLSGRIEMLYKNSHFDISPKTILINEKGDSIRLEDINFSKYLFIVRFSEFNCMSCITEEMKHISSFLKLNNNIISLATYSRHNDLLNSKRAMNISFPVYNIPFEVFGNDMEKRRLPYYFIINKHYQVCSLFIADPNNFKLTDRYLSYVEKLLCSQ